MRLVTAALVLAALSLGAWFAFGDTEDGREPERSVPAVVQDGTDVEAAEAGVADPTSDGDTSRAERPPIFSDSEPALTPLRVFVRDSERGAPIASSSVEVVRRGQSITNALTNAEGLVEFDPRIASSASIVRVEKEGYCSKSFPLARVEDAVLAAARVLTVELAPCEVSVLHIVDGFDRQPVPGVSIFLRPTRPVLLGIPTVDGRHRHDEERDPIDYRMLGLPRRGFRTNRPPIDPLSQMVGALQQMVSRVPHQVEFAEPDLLTPIGDDVVDHSVRTVRDGYHDLLIVKHGYAAVFLPEVEFPLAAPLEVVLERSEARVRVEVSPQQYRDGRRWPLQFAFERWLIHAEADETGVFEGIALGEGVRVTVAVSRLLPSGERIRFESKESRSREDLVSNGKPIDIRFRADPLEMRTVSGVAVAKSLDEQLRFRAVGGGTQFDDDHVIPRDARDFLLRIEAEAEPRLVAVGDRSGLWRSDPIARRADTVELRRTHLSDQVLDLRLDGLVGTTNWSLRPLRFFEDPDLRMPSIAEWSGLSDQSRPRTLSLSDAQLEVLARQGALDGSAGVALLHLERLVPGHYRLSAESRDADGRRTVGRVDLAVPTGVDTETTIALEAEPTGIAFGRVPMSGHDFAFVRIGQGGRDQTIQVGADGRFEIELPVGPASFEVLLPDDGFSVQQATLGDSSERDAQRQLVVVRASIVEDERIEVPFGEALLRIRERGGFDAALSGLISVSILGWAGPIDEIDLMLVRTAAQTSGQGGLQSAIAASSKLLPIRERAPTIVRGLEPAASYSVLVRDRSTGNVLGWADVPVGRTSHEVLVSVSPVRNLEVFADHEPGVYLVPVSPEKQRILGARIEPAVVTNGVSTFSLFPPGAYFIVRHGHRFESLSSREQIPFDIFNDDMTIDLRTR